MSIIRGTVEKDPETLVQPFEQDSFSRILLERPHRLLNRPDLSPIKCSPRNWSLETVEKT